MAVAATVGLLLYPAALSDGAAALPVPRGAVALAYTILFSSSLNYILIVFAASRVAPSMISVWQFAQPVATIPLAYAFFAELPSGRQLGGCWLILVALAAVCYDSMRQVWTL